MPNPTKLQDPTSTPPTLAERNKAVIRRFVDEVVNGDDMTAVDTLFAPDYVCHVSGADDVRGRDGVRAIAQRFRGGFPDWRNDTTRLILVADGDFVATRWHESGTHLGTFDGVPPSGRKVSLAGHDLFRLQEGKVAEQWLECDLAGFRARLASGGNSAARQPAASAADLGLFMHQMKDAIINAHNAEAADRFYAEAFATRNPIPGRASGLVGLKGALAEFFTAFPDVHEVVEDTVSDGVSVAAVGRIQATHLGPFAGIQATGRRVVFRIFELHHVKAGKVTDGWVFIDMAGLLAQLRGAV